jgi:mannose-6-phosphate isomerase-like protein (cupin superfamily)
MWVTIEWAMNIYRSSKLKAEGGAYIEFIRTPDLSAGMYLLKAGEVDAQTPHNEEEIHYVISGRARFLCGEENSGRIARRIDPAVAADLDLRLGQVLFWKSDEPHRYRWCGSGLGSDLSGSHLSWEASGIAKSLGRDLAARHYLSL